MQHGLTTIQLKIFLVVIYQRGLSRMREMLHDEKKYSGLNFKKFRKTSLLVNNLTNIVKENPNFGKLI